MQCIDLTDRFLLVDMSTQTKTRDIYVSPHETQDPDEYVTEVCYAVK